MDPRLKKLIQVSFATAIMIIAFVMISFLYSQFLSDKSVFVRYSYCGFVFVLILIALAFLYYRNKRLQRKRKFKEYEYPGKKKKKNRDRSSKSVIASFKDLALNEDREQSYKIFITADKVYLMQYFQYNRHVNTSGTGHMVKFQLLIDLFILIFNKPLNIAARPLDRRHLEKTKSIKELIEKIDHFYEFNRSNVHFKLRDSDLILFNKGRYRHVMCGKGPKEDINEQLEDNMIWFFFDPDYYDEYSEIIETHF